MLRGGCLAFRGGRFAFKARCLMVASTRLHILIRQSPLWWILGLSVPARRVFQRRLFL